MRAARRCHCCGWLREHVLRHLLPCRRRRLFPTSRAFPIRGRRIKWLELSRSKQGLAQERNLLKATDQVTAVFPWLVSGKRLYQGEGVCLCDLSIRPHQTEAATTGLDLAQQMQILAPTALLTAVRDERFQIGC
jgi:hypothetical protein